MMCAVRTGSWMGSPQRKKGSKGGVQAAGSLSVLRLKRLFHSQKVVSGVWSCGRSAIKQLSLPGYFSLTQRNSLSGVGTPKLKLSISELQLSNHNSQTLNYNFQIPNPKPRNHTGALETLSLSLWTHLAHAILSLHFDTSY